MSVEDKAKKIKLVVLDVDGVLTDGQIVTGSQGELCKHFDVKDGLGIKMLLAAGIDVVVITGRRPPSSARGFVSSVSEMCSRASPTRKVRSWISFRLAIWTLRSAPAWATTFRICRCCSWWDSPVPRRTPLTQF